jgi:signal transduction histidine kinase
MHPVVKQGETVLLADGTRAHDQRIAAPDGARWIALARGHDPHRRQQGDAKRRPRCHQSRARRTRFSRRVRLGRGGQSRESRFLTTASHEIRTPLSGILGMADLLGDTPLNANRRPI